MSYSVNWLINKKKVLIFKISTHDLLTLFEGNIYEFIKYKVGIMVNIVDTIIHAYYSVLFYYLIKP